VCNCLVWKRFYKILGFGRELEVLKSYILTKGSSISRKFRDFGNFKLLVKNFGIFVKIIFIFRKLDRLFQIIES
jgi:hypothetical protein